MSEIELRDATYQPVMASEQHLLVLSDQPPSVMGAQAFVAAFPTTSPALSDVLKGG